MGGRWLDADQVKGRPDPDILRATSEWDGIAGRPKTFYRPNVRIMLAEGAVEVTGRCPRMDRYGHDSEKGAMACFRHLASERGATIL